MGFIFCQLCNRNVVRKFLILELIEFFFLTICVEDNVAIILSCWVSECDNGTTSSPTTESVEFYPTFLARGFCLLQNIFLRSTLDDDFFESLRMLLGISSWSHCFPILLIVWVLQKQICYKITSSIIIQPLVLFNSIKLCYISSHMQS